MKLVLTGGHHTSALPVIEELKKLDPAIELIWVGHKFSMQKDTNPSAEYKEITALGLSFYDIKAGKFYKVYNPFKLFQVFSGFLNAFNLLLKLRPDGILSFGGYIAVPVVVAGFILGIPSVTHEQTVVSGFANRILSLFVKRIFISWEGSVKYFPKDKVIITGLPVRKSILKPETNIFKFDTSLPLVYITGGKQGAHILNEAIKPILIPILQMANVIHQCGSFSVYNDLQVLNELKKSFPEKLSSRYYVLDYIPSDTIGEVLTKSSIVISRAGANTVYELFVLKKPCILIPIPWVSHNEQVKNAKVLEEAGLGKIILQKDLNSEILLEEVKNMLNSLANFRLKNTGKVIINLESAKLIAHETYKTLFEK